MTAPQPGAGLRRVARGGALNMAGAVAGAALNTVLVVVVTRGFSPETAGVLFAATSVYFIAAAVANLGTATGVVYFVARVRALGAGHLVPVVLRRACGPVAAVAVAAGAALWVGAADVARFAGAEGAADYVRVLAVVLPFAVVTDTLLAATRAFHDMRPTVALEKVGRPLAQVGLVAAVAATGGAGLLAAAWAGPYLPAALLALFWLRRVLRAAPPAEVPEAAAPPGGVEREVAARAFWAFTLPRSASTVAQLGIQRGGIVLVAALRGAADAAVLTAASRLLVVGQFAGQAVQHAAQPRLAELLAVGDREGAADLYRTATAWLVCLTWPVLLPAALYAPLVMGVFGDGYSGGAGVLVVLALTQMAGAALGMGDLVLTMTGRSRAALGNNVAALAVNVAGCVALVPALGAEGAAAAWAGAVLLRNLLPLAQLARGYGLHPFGRRWLLAAGACLGWFGAVPAAALAVLGPGAWSLAAALAAGGAGYAVTLWRLRGALGLAGLLRRRGSAAAVPPVSGTSRDITVRNR